MSTPPNALPPPPPGYGYKNDPVHGYVLVQLSEPGAAPPPAPPPAARERGDYEFARGQNFDVILIKKGVNGMQATPADFKRLSVSANSVTETQSLPEVLEAMKAGFEYYQTTAPGHTTEFEHMARRRAADEARGEMDRSKI